MTKTNPLVSIVSITHNRCPDILELLVALGDQEYSSLEIIVVDNASSDGTAGEIARRFPDVKLIRNPQNTGMVAYNTGRQVARGEYILFIDDDGLPTTPDWVRQMVSCFEDNPKLGVVACQIRLAANQKLAPDSPQYLRIDDGFGGYPCPAFVCTGAGVRASALNSVGLFPSFFFRSYMEFTLSTKLWNSGWQVRLFPSIEVLHKKSPAEYSKSRAYDYWGLRNYYWYVWMLYPWPAVLEETIFHAIHSFKVALRREYSVKKWPRALFDAVAGFRVVASHRQPISRNTLGWYYQLRQHRRPSFFCEARLGGNHEISLTSTTQLTGTIK